METGRVEGKLNNPRRDKVLPNRSYSSISVMKAMAKRNLKRKGIISGYSSIKQSITKGGQGRKLDAGVKAEAIEESSLLVHSS